MTHSVTEGGKMDRGMACAFPSPEIRGYDGTGICAPEYGVSIREWYAGLAMQGYLAMYAGSEVMPPTAEVAVHAVAYADSLLEELAKRAAKEQG